jgi:ABC-type polysaccharide/polyol phosphate export permease
MSSSPIGIESVSSDASLLEHFRRLYARRETVLYLATRNLKAGHRDKVLGHLWSLLDPLLFMLVYFLVFGVLFGIVRGGGGGRSFEFMLYILVGILVFRFVYGTSSQSANAIRSNRGLIQEINFPKAVFPISVVFSRLYDYMWGMIVFVAILLVGGGKPTLYYLWLPVLILLMVLFTSGMAMILSCVGAFFADTPNVLAVTMRLFFYGSPIFYFVRDCGQNEAQLKNETVRFFYMLNPLACFIECSRDAVLWGTTPELRYLIYVAVVSVVVALVGFAVFTRVEGRFAKYI